MPSFHPRLIAFLRTHHGTAATSDLDAVGVSPAALRSMLDVGELIRVREGVYRHALWPDTFESRCAGACAADPTVVVCCGGATRLWEFRGCTRLDFHATSTRSGLTLAAPPLLHRCAVMPDAHIHDRGDGIRVTSPVRTMFDIAKHVTWSTLESAIEQGIRRGQFDVTALYDLGRMLCARGRDGSALYAAVVNSRPAWRRPADSHPELVLRDALERVGVVVQPQVSLTLPGGQVIHPDLGDPSIGFYIEIDDHEWHGGRLSSTYDDQRDRLVRLTGGWVERVSTDEIAPLRPGLLTELRSAYESQQRAHHSRSLVVM